MPPSQAAEEGLSQLGSGGRDDRLGFRLVVATLWRCVSLLRPVRWHVVVLAFSYAATALVIFPLILVLFDLFWTRAIEGQPLTAETAASFQLDPAIAVTSTSFPRMRAGWWRGAPCSWRSSASACWSR